MPGIRRCAGRSRARPARRRGVELHQHGARGRGAAGTGRGAAQPARRRQGGEPAAIRCAGGCAPRRRSARPTRRLPQGPARGTVWIEERLVAALGAPVGARLRLGRSEFTVAAVLTLEPERSANFFNIAPRLMMHLDDVAATGLVQHRQPGRATTSTPRARARRSTAFEAWAATAPRARPAHRHAGKRPAERARLARSRAALSRPDRAARRDTRRRRRRARHAPLRRAPSRRRRGDALPRRAAGAAAGAVRRRVLDPRPRGLRAGQRARLRGAGRDRRHARRPAARRAAGADAGARAARLPRRAGAAARLCAAAAGAAEERAGAARHAARGRRAEGERGRDLRHRPRPARRCCSSGRRATYGSA